MNGIVGPLASFNGLGVISYSVTPTGGLIVLLISIVRAHLVSLKKKVGYINVTQKGSFFGNLWLENNL